MGAGRPEGCQAGRCSSCAGTGRGGFTARHPGRSARRCQTAGGAASGSGHRRVPWCRHGAPSRIEAGTVKGGSRASAPGRAGPAGGRASPPRRSAHPRPVNDGRIGNEPHPAHLHRALDPALDAQRPAAAHADPEPFRSLSDGQQSRYFHAPSIAQTLDNGQRIRQTSGHGTHDDSRQRGGPIAHRMGRAWTTSTARLPRGAPSGRCARSMTSASVVMTAGGRCREARHC